MAVVYRAEDAVGRIVALKQLLPQNEFDLDFDLVRSFVEEAHLATRFHHRNLTTTHSLGKVDGSYFIEMEYVPGPTLLSVAAMCRRAGALPVSVVVQIMLQLCDALDHVHTLTDDAGRCLDLVHRDVSMSNIIVSNGGIVKLIDFGIVKGHSSQAPTAAGLIKGKLAYVAPEYLAGQLDSRADLFAVGVIAHELLTDRRLFYGHNDLDTLTKLRTMRIAPPSRTRADIPGDLDAIVMTALERDPDRRWQSARAMRAALVELQGEVDPHPIAEWVAWATTQPEPTFDSTLVDVLEKLDEPTVTVELEPQLVTPEAVVVTSSIRASAVSSSMLFLMSLLCGLASVALVLVYLGH